MSTLRLVSEETASSPSYDFVKLQNNYHWNCKVFVYALVTKQYVAALRAFQRIFVTPCWITLFLSGLAYMQAKNQNMWKGYKWNYLLASVFLSMSGVSAYYLDNKEVDEIDYDEETIKAYIEWLKN